MIGPVLIGAALAGDLEIGLAGGATLLSDTHELYDPSRTHQPLGPMAQGLARVGFYPIGDIGLAAEADFGGSALGRLYSVRGLAEVGWPITSTRLDWAPFVVGGVGLIGVDGAASGNDQDLDLQWGLGTRLTVARDLRVRVDLRHHPLASYGTTGSSHSFSGWVGLSWRPGKATPVDRARVRLEEMLGAFEEVPTRREVAEVGTPAEVEQALIKIARDPRVPPSRRGRAVTAVVARPSLRVKYEMQRLLGREVPKGWRAEVRRAEKAAAGEPPPIEEVDEAPVSEDPLRALVTRPKRAPSFEPAPAEALDLGPAPPVPPARRRGPRTDPAVFRRAVSAYAQGFGAESAGLVAEILRTTDDPLTQVAAVQALRDVPSPVASSALAEVPSLKVEVVDAEGKPTRNAEITATLPDGRALIGVGFLDRIDPTLPTGDAVIRASRGACERGEGSASVGPAAPVAQVALRPHRPMTWRWTITDDQQAALSGEVRLTPAEGTSTACGPESARFEAGAGALALGPGRWTARFTADGYRFTDVEVVAGDGAPPADAAVQLQPTVLRVEKGKIQAEPLFFETGLAVLTASSAAALERVARTILDADISFVTIEGHTDDVGDDEENMRLSGARAAAVREALVAHGVAEDRLFAIGFGERRPVAPGTSKAARAANRRVDFVLDAP